MILRRLPGFTAWDWRNPFEELERIKRQMDRLSGDFPEEAFREPAAGVFPLINLTEDKNNYYVRAELPGIKTDDLDISVTGNSLSVSGQKKTIEEMKDAKFHRSEREEGVFSRMVSIPDHVETDKVEATCTNGILTVVLPKAESEKPKQISVKST